MHFWLEFTLIIGICLLLTSLAFLKNVLTFFGSVLALFIGLVIGLTGGFSWVLLLFIFLVTSFAATKYKFKTKKKKGLHEGVRGERGWENVLANGLAPLVIALLCIDDAPYPTLDRQIGTVLFLCAVAIAASDTLASELGMLSRRTWLITTGKRVRPGTNGGISSLGQFWAIAAAFYAGAMGMLVLGYFEPGLSISWWTVILITIIGFLGCQIDSVIGATIEGKPGVTKLTNNLMSITIGTIIAWLLMIWLG